MTICEFKQTFEDHTSTHYTIHKWDEDAQDFKVIKTYNFFEDLEDDDAYDYEEISTDKGISLHNGNINIYLD